VPEQQTFEREISRKILKKFKIISGFRKINEQLV